MAVDIVLAKNGNPIRNRTVLVNSKTIRNGLLTYSTYDARVINTPSITDIENRYDNLFDDPSYYYGGGNGNDNSVDGGNVGNVVVGG